MAVMPEGCLGCSKVLASALSCSIIQKPGKGTGGDADADSDADAYKLCQPSVPDPNCSAPILRVPCAILPTVIHQLVKGPCYIPLSKLFGRFSQKVNLL